MSSTLSILYIIDVIKFAEGTEWHLFNLVKALNQRGHECTIVAFDMKKIRLIDKMEKMGIEVIHIPVGRYYTFDALKKARVLSRVIKKRKINIVQTFHFKADVYGSIVARLSGAKNIISSKRDTASFKRPHHFFLHRVVRPITKRYIAVCKSVAEVVARMEAVPHSKIKIIYNGVDTSRFKPVERELKSRLRADLGVGASDFVVAIIGGLRREKNHATVFRAARLARSKIPGLKILVIGGGGHKMAYISQVKKMGLTDTVIFTDSVEDVMEYLAVSDIGCLVPSSNEGFSNAVLEQMAAGLPLIVSSVGGNPEAVIDGQTGFVIDPMDYKNLAELMVKLFRNPQEREKMGKEARKRAVEYYSIDKMIDEHEQLYQEILQDNHVCNER